jgi:MFS family permease
MDPLWRNRDFVLLQTGRLLSNLGSQMSSLAYPLLVLATTHSPAKAGVVGFVRALPWALFALPAGVAADRWSRKGMMIASDLVRAVAVGALAAAVAAGEAAFGVIAVVAFVEGTGAAVFMAAQPGALRAVVPRQQLPAASAVETGRGAAGMLAGPPLGGALFGIAHALPFVADAASYVASTVSLLWMRTPFQEQRERDSASLRARLAEGLRFQWHQPFLRTTACLYGLTNFIGPGVLLALVVIGQRQGLSGGAVGVLVAAFAGGLLLGSFASGFVRRTLPVRRILLLELWTWLGCAAFVAWPNVYVLAASILPTAFAIPSTDSVVTAYRIAMTPDRLLGRSESVRSTIALLIAPLGPLTAGALLDSVSARATIAVFAAAALVLALWGTLSEPIRRAPSLDDLEAVAATP